MSEKHGRPRKRKAKERPPSTDSALSASKKRDNPLLGVALLKVALELKKGQGKSLDEVASSVLSGMGLQRDALREYLAREDLARRLERLNRR